MREDARRLSPEALDAVRRRVMRAVCQGMAQAQAARLFGVSRQSVNGWHQRWRAGGLRALRSRPRGRPPVARLKPYQAAIIVRLITGRCPDQLQLPFVLWTREAIRDLIARRCGVHLSVWTVGRYLRHWGLTPQKPIRRAYERDPAAVRRWLRRQYPAIRALARREHATRKLFLILDSHPVHVGAQTQRWVKRHRKQMRLFFLPGYSPELNPDELLNQDVKTNAVGRKRPRTPRELVGNVRRFLWSTQRRPNKVRNYFRHPNVRYAA